jgi:glycosyltransferase involved in cell wall biosynthesis
MKRILFAVPYPVGESPSQRFRFEQYLDALRDQGWGIRVISFWSSAGWRILYKKGKGFHRLLHATAGIVRMVRLIFRAVGSDYVFIHRGAVPLGPPVVEWIIARVMKKKVIFDFDDAIWMPSSATESSWLRWIKCYWKVDKMIRWSHGVSAGNEFLRQHALAFNRNSRYVPTTVDTERSHIPSRSAMRGQTITVGWTGTHSTLAHLEALEPLLVRAIRELPIRLLVIANEKPRFAFTGLEVRVWSKEAELSDLREIDIGLMPLPNDGWSQGKCGLKLIQYMALAIPALASPIGVNPQILEHGRSGFLCSTENEWFEGIQRLTLDADLRGRMGEAGRKRIVDHFSVVSNLPTFMSLFA